MVDSDTPELPGYDPRQLSLSGRGLWGWDAVLLRDYRRYRRREAPSDFVTLGPVLSESQPAIQSPHEALLGRQRPAVHGLRCGEDLDLVVAIQLF